MLKRWRVLLPSAWPSQSMAPYAQKSIVKKIIALKGRPQSHSKMTQRFSLQYAAIFESEPSNHRLVV